MAWVQMLWGIEGWDWRGNQCLLTSYSSEKKRDIAIKHLRKKFPEDRYEEIDIHTSIANFYNEETGEIRYRY